MTITVTDHITDDMTRDEAIIALVTGAGVSLNKATQLWVAHAKETGITQTLTSYKDEAITWLDENYDLEVKTWDGKAVSDAVKDLMAEFNVAESTARDYCKAYSKKHGVPHPVTDPRKLMFQYLIDNCERMDYDTLKSGFKKYASEELNRSPSNINEYWKGYDLHLALMEAKS